MARSSSRDIATPTTVRESSTNKRTKGFAKERPPIPTGISLAYGAPGRVAMPQRLRPNSKNEDVAEAIQEALEEDQSAQLTSPIREEEEEEDQIQSQMNGHEATSEEEEADENPKDASDEERLENVSGNSKDSGSEDETPDSDKSTSEEDSKTRRRKLSQQRHNRELQAEAEGYMEGGRATTVNGRGGRWSLERHHLKSLNAEHHAKNHGQGSHQDEQARNRSQKVTGSQTKSQDYPDENERILYDQQRQWQSQERDLQEAARQDFSHIAYLPHRSFATEARIASEARIRQPQIPLRVRCRRTWGWLSRKWDEYGGDTIAAYLGYFAKVAFLVATFVFALQYLRPYLSSVHLPSLDRMKHSIGVHRSPDGKIVLDNRPLTALEELTTSQYRSLRSRLDEVESSYTRLASSINASPPPSRKINFFAVGSGVVVDPYLTSPTKQISDKTTYWGIRSLFRGIDPKPFPPPMMALTAWDDMGDCWCAPDAGGKSQLALSLNKWIVPQELVVENIPRSATMSPGSAPKDLELWVQILDPQRREAVRRAALSYRINSSENERRATRTKESLDETWIRIGSWQYNLYSVENVQTFPIEVPLDHFRTPVKRLTIRTLSNWGEVDYVCLYRLRLHGLLAKNTTTVDSSEEAVLNLPN